MDNQHKKITGYRDLSQAEIDLMNEIKAKGEELRALIAKIGNVVAPIIAITEAAAGSPPVEGAVITNIENEGDAPAYWLRYADSCFRSGLMYAVRAVARPASY